MITYYYGWKNFLDLVNIEHFVDKYLTTNQTILKGEIWNMQIHQHKQILFLDLSKVYGFKPYIFVHPIFFKYKRHIFD
jgi:hypothetical protein